ncbi:helix-turn-helix transcriptional regulator [Nocardioides sp. R-C-SC26]|uniref:helix-turn-helix domain-containing protein n=1 Tax=Nocardioides sp. R-C-SC26 TaxID=2870414 RepID=UPI001E28660E|nr:helix-turn-helix transcriptional regulator [Nocardioides sp. R-C-SC26]
MLDSSPLGRGPIVADLVERLRGDSAVVLGATGLGRTTVLRAVADAGGTALVAGRESLDQSPFVPFLALLAEHGLSPDDPLSVLAGLPSALLASRARLVVDDIERLDAASAVLLGQSLRAGVPMVLGLTEITAAPEPLRDLVLTMAQSRLTPLGADDAADLGARCAGGPLDPPSVAALWRRSHGIPGVITAIVDAAVACGAVRQTRAGIHLTRLPATHTALEALGLSTDALERHRPLLQLVAVAHRMPVGALPADELAAATADGVLREDGAVAWLPAQLAVDWALAELSGERRRDLARRAVLGLDAVAGGESLPWRTHAARLRTLAGDGDAVVETARWLASTDRREEALALVGGSELTAADTGRRDAVEQRERAGGRSGLPEPPVLLARADVLADLGLVDAAIATLDLAAVEATESELLDITRRLADLLRGGVEEDAALDQRLLAFASRLEDAELRRRWEAAVARRQVVRGAAMTSEEDPLAALLRESLTGSLSAARAGSGVTDLAPGSLPVVEADTPDEMSMDRHFRVLIHFLSLVYDGRLVEGREIAEHEYALATHRVDPVLGLWSYNRTKIALHAGQYEESARVGTQMMRDLEWRDPFGLLVSGRALLASAVARLGRIVEAEAMIADLGAIDADLPRARLGIARVRAERLLLEGRPHDAAEALAEAGRWALDHDEAHSGLLGLDEAFWCDPTPERARPLVEAEERSGLTAAFAMRAKGLLDGDTGAMTRAAELLEQAIQPGRAASTWTAIARRADETGDVEGSSAARRQAARLALRWSCVPWPDRDDRITPLSEREHEVARRAGARLRSREIAEQLDLSSRTVDNHLARVFRKVGVRSREELAEVLGIGTAAMVRR